MKSEKDLIRSKYETGYPNLFQNLTDSLDNESMAYGDYLNKNTKYKQGSNQQLVSKMWDVDGLSIEYNKFITNINSYRDQIDNSKYTLLSCDTIKQADITYNNIYSNYQNFLNKWKSETSISSNKWIAHFDKLILGQQVVLPIQNIIPQQLIPQNNEDLLKKIKEIEDQKIILKDQLNLQKFENTSLKDQNTQLKDQNTQLKETINDQKIVIGEQKETIIDLREDKKDLKEKVTEQKVEIDHLKEDLHVQVEKVQEVTEKHHIVNDKYIGLKTHFNELVVKHHVFDDTYEVPVELAGDNELI